MVFGLKAHTRLILYKHMVFSIRLCGWIQSAFECYKNSHTLSLKHTIMIDLSLYVK